jgi:hypothetical protein
MTRKQSETVQLKLRFPERLRLRIEAAANRNQRSLNAEIIDRLDQSFRRDDTVANNAALVKATATAVVDQIMAVAGKQAGLAGQGKSEDS